MYSFSSIFGNTGWNCSEDPAVISDWLEKTISVDGDKVVSRFSTDWSDGVSVDVVSWFSFATDLKKNIDEIRLYCRKNKFHLSFRFNLSSNVSRQTWRLVSRQRDRISCSGILENMFFITSGGSVWFFVFRNEARVWIGFVDLDVDSVDPKLSMLLIWPFKTVSELKNDLRRWFSFILYYPIGDKSIKDISPCSASTVPAELRPAKFSLFCSWVSSEYINSLYLCCLSLFLNWIIF